jgi:hypothetical protein
VTTVSCILRALCCVVLTLGNAAAEEPNPPLVLERAIPLQDVSGRIDHMAIDLGRNRLLVAELGNGTADIIDLRSGKAVHRIAGLREPQGIGYAPGSDMIAIASAADGSVRLLRAGDFAQVATIGLGEDADNVRLDPQTGHLLVGYGTGGLAVIDSANRTIVSRTILPAHPEGFQLDPLARRAYINLPDAREIAVVDLRAGKLVTAWRVPPSLRANFPMARADTDGMLATVFRNPPRLVLLNPQTGAEQARLPTCGDADDVFFDSRRHRIYISCGDGTVDVLRNEPLVYGLVSRVKTSSGARTSLFVPELDRLFIAARAGYFGFGSDAAILVYRPLP